MVPLPAGDMNMNPIFALSQNTETYTGIYWNILEHQHSADLILWMQVRTLRYFNPGAQFLTGPAILKLNPASSAVAVWPFLDEGVRWYCGGQDQITRSPDMWFIDVHASSILVIHSIIARRFHLYLASATKRYCDHKAPTCSRDSEGPQALHFWVVLWVWGLVGWH